MLRGKKLWLIYSDTDDAYRKGLERHLLPRAKAAEFFIEHRGGARAGELLSETIARGMGDAEGFVLLVSPDLLASTDRFAEVEAALATGRPIFPVALRSCDWTTHPSLERLADYALPHQSNRTGAPLRGITLHEWGDEDAYFTAVVHGLARALGFADTSPMPDSLSRGRWDFLRRRRWPLAAAFALLTATALLLLRRPSVVLPQRADGATVVPGGVVVGCASTASEATHEARDLLNREVQKIPPAQDALAIQMAEPFESWWRGGSTQQDVLREMAWTGHTLLVVVEAEGSPETQRARLTTPGDALVGDILNAARPQITDERGAAALARVLRPLSIALAGASDATFDVPVPDPDKDGDSAALLGVLARHYGALAVAPNEARTLARILDMRRCAQNADGICCLAGALVAWRGVANAPTFDESGCNSLPFWAIATANRDLAAAHHALDEEGPTPHALEVSERAQATVETAINSLVGLYGTPDFPTQTCANVPTAVLRGMGWAEGASTLRARVNAASGKTGSSQDNTLIECLANKQLDPAGGPLPVQERLPLAAALEERADWRASAGDWAGAARDSETAAKLTGDYAHWLSWAEALLCGHQTVDSARARTVLKDPPGGSPGLRIYGAFLRLLIQLQNGSADGSQEKALMLQLYTAQDHGVLDGEVALNDVNGALGRLVCGEQSEAWAKSTCSTYRALTQPKTSKNGVLLASLLGEGGPPEAPPP